MILTLFFLQISTIFSISQGWPYKCTGMTTFIFLPNLSIHFSISCGEILYVFSSISAKIIFALQCSITSAVAVKVNGVVIT